MPRHTSGLPDRVDAVAGRGAVGPGGRRVSPVLTEVPGSDRAEAGCRTAVDTAFRATTPVRRLQESQ
ncbi:hypothetical protein [Streptomyces sp. NPDC018031]|uniref:hypothetical protein n=1 Tax=Streptomyces sp. NPDC018031 TaxID=3365033 RepID=UPI00378D5956